MTGALSMSYMGAKCDWTRKPSAPARTHFVASDRVSAGAMGAEVDACGRRRRTHHRDAAVRELGLAEEEELLLRLGREAKRVCGGGRRLSQGGMGGRGA